MEIHGMFPTYTIIMTLTYLAAHPNNVLTKPLRKKNVKHKQCIACIYIRPEILFTVYCVCFLSFSFL